MRNRKNKTIVIVSSIGLLFFLSFTISIKNIVKTNDYYSESQNNDSFIITTVTSAPVTTPSTITISPKKEPLKEVTYDFPKTTTKKVTTVTTTTWDGPVLNSFAGIIEGPSGNETYYNLDMSGVVSNMQNLGYNYKYWVRNDGVKMFGDYVMCAANLETRPKGTIIETSLGTGIVCDTGGFVSWDPNRLDIAVTW